MLGPVSEVPLAVLPAALSLQLWQPEVPDRGTDLRAWRPAASRAWPRQVGRAVLGWTHQEVRSPAVRSELLGLEAPPRSAPSRLAHSPDSPAVLTLL